MTIYASLGVDEVWRYDDGLAFLSLGEDGSYEPVNPRRQLPQLNVEEAMRQLDANRSMGRLDWMRAFRRHVRENLVPNQRSESTSPSSAAEQPTAGH